MTFEHQSRPTEIVNRQTLIFGILQSFLNGMNPVEGLNQTRLSHFKLKNVDLVSAFLYFMNPWTKSCQCGSPSQSYQLSSLGVSFAT